MSCKQVNLNTANCLAVNSGYDYVFNARSSIDLTGKTIYFKVKSVNDVGFIFELTNSNNPNVSGVYINSLSPANFDIIIKASDSVGVTGNKVFECYIEDVSSKDLLFQGSILFNEGVINE